MSSTDGEIGMRNGTDKANQQRLEERLEKDAAAVKNDIAALTDQITTPPFGKNILTMLTTQDIF